MSVKYALVKTELWKRASFLEMPAEGKVFYFYLLTNPHQSYGFIPAFKTYASAMTGIGAKTLEKLFKDFILRGYIKYDEKTDEVLFLGYFSHQFNSSSKTIKGALRYLLKEVASPKLKAVWVLKALNTLRDKPEAMDLLLTLAQEWLGLTEEQLGRLAQEESENILLLEAPQVNDPYAPKRGEVKNIVELYNRLCPSLPKAKKLSPERERLLRSFIKWAKKEFGEEYQNAVITALKKVEASDFLTGRNGGWGGANIDWVFKKGNFLKILEGKYDNDRYEKGKKSQAQAKSIAQRIKNDPYARFYRQSRSTASPHQPPQPEEEAGKNDKDDKPLDEGEGDAGVK